MIVLARKSEGEHEQQFIKHMTQDTLWKQDMDQLKKDKGKIVIGTQDMIRRHGRRLICPKCERGAFRHGSNDRARCNLCGWEGYSITVDEYITEKLYRR